MNKIEFIQNIKLVDLARFFINEYQYIEIKLKNIEGVFLENRSREFPLIRISTRSNINMVNYNKELDNIKRLYKEYCSISSLDNPKILSIYFNGEVILKEDNIYAAVLKDNNDISSNDLIEEYFPEMKSKFDLTKYVGESDYAKTLLNLDFNTSKNNFKEIKISELLGVKDLNRKSIFTLAFTGTFIIFNLLFLLMNLNYLNIEINYAFYSVFILHLEQYYRIFTGLFLSDSVLSTIIYAFFLYRYMSYIEIKLGTKKTIILYVISIVAVYIAMFTLARGDVMFSPYPIIAITAAGYLSILLLPSQLKLLKFNQMNIVIMLMLFVTLSIISIFNPIVVIVAFLVSFVLVKGLDLIDNKINYKIVISTSIISLLLILTNYIPSQTLYRDYEFEKKYFKYEMFYDKDNALKKKEKIDKYYKRIGAIDYE